MKSNKIAVVYHSVTGTTKQLAQGVITGVQSVSGMEASDIDIRNADIVEGRYINAETLDLISQADGVVFGSPTFMGGVTAQFKAFADASSELWSQRAWSNKVAAGFTIGSNFSGDQLSTLQYLSVFAGQHGMLWANLDISIGLDGEVRNRLGAQSGVVAHTETEVVDEIDIQTAQYLGARVAKLAKSLRADSSSLS